MTTIPTDYAPFIIEHSCMSSKAAYVRLGDFDGSARHAHLTPEQTREAIAALEGTLPEPAPALVVGGRYRVTDGGYLYAHAGDVYRVTRPTPDRDGDVFGVIERTGLYEWLRPEHLAPLDDEPVSSTPDTAVGDRIAVTYARGYGNLGGALATVTGTFPVGHYRHEGRVGVKLDEAPEATYGVADIYADRWLSADAAWLAEADARTFNVGDRVVVESAVYTYDGDVLEACLVAEVGDVGTIARFHGDGDADVDFGRVKGEGFVHTSGLVLLQSAAEAEAAEFLAEATSRTFAVGDRVVIESTVFMGGEEVGSSATALGVGAVVTVTGGPDYDGDYEVMHPDHPYGAYIAACGLLPAPEPEGEDVLIVDLYCNTGDEVTRRPGREPHYSDPQGRLVVSVGAVNNGTLDGVKVRRFAFTPEARTVFGYLDACSRALEAERRSL